MEAYIKGQTPENKSIVYIGMIIATNIFSIFLVFGSRIFDKNGGVIHGLSKFIFWVAYVYTSSAYYAGAGLHCAGAQPLSYGVTIMKICFSFMILLGAYGVFSEVKAELNPPKDTIIT